MKPNHIRLIVFVPVSAVLAQTLPPPTATEAPIELNPFVITATADEGYAPTETLAGTRLKTPVKDVPSAISIISADMLKDLGALNFTDVLDYLPSTARYQSTESDPDNNGQRTGNPYIVRGFQSGGMTTNFFSAMTPIDTYNTSRLTFTRGPNSILFGVGNPGGGLDIVTNRPDLNRNAHTLSLRVDSFDSSRAALDANFVIVPKKLGLRLDLLDEDQRRYVVPATSQRRSLFASMSYSPRPATTVTLNGETTRIRRQVPRSTVVFDQYTPWLQAGAPIKPVYGNVTATPGLEYASASGYIVIVEGQPQMAPMNWLSSAFGARARVNNVFSNRTSFSAPVVVPLNTNLTGAGDHADADASNVSLFVQQAVGRRFFFEVAGKFEHQYLLNFEGPSGTENAVKVDANAQLPDGRPNPMVGKPYVESNLAFWVKRPTDTAQGRFTASYEIDLNHLRIAGRPLGRISLAGLFSSERAHQLLDNAMEVNLTPLLTTGTLGRLDNGVNWIHRRCYLVPGKSSFFTSDFGDLTGNGIRTGFARARATPRNNITETKATVFSGQADLLDNLVVGTAGVRRERVLQEQGVYVRDALGVYPDISGSSGTIATNDRGRTYSAGVVLNATKHLSLFANRATNFVPSNQSQVSIDGVPIPPSAGEGYDVGIKFNLLGGKIQGSVNRFFTVQRNATDGTAIGNKRSAIQTIWTAIDLNRVPETGWTDFKNTETRGYEFQLVGNPTSNLRLMLTASKNITRVPERGIRLFPYIERNLPEWQTKASTPVANTAFGTTVGQLVTVITNEMANDRLLFGIRQTRSAEWQFSGMGRYRFAPTSRLAGFALGSAFVWRDEPVIGYKVLPGKTLLDVTQPFFGAKTFNVDAWIDYSRTLLRKRIRWEAQLRVQNVFDDRNAKPWTALDDGTGGRFVEQRLLPNALGVSLSSKFSF
jgi:outer membrane receptor protein involved in Fe transport